MDTTADLSRRLANLIRVGTVAKVDYAAARCTVNTGGLLTAPLRWIVQRAGDARRRWAPSEGEQVLVLSPSGDLAAAVVLPALYSDRTPPPDGGDTADVTTYPDGARLAYDPATHQLDAQLPSGGKAKIIADGGLAITGDTTVMGTLHVSKDITGDTKITAQNDVIGGGISLKIHKTTGVTPGSGVSGGPE